MDRSSLAGDEGEERIDKKKSFQVCALIESNPSMVRKDDVVRQALEKVQAELVQDVEEYDCEEDPFADIVPEEDINVQDSPLVITDE